MANYRAQLFVLFVEEKDFSPQTLGQPRFQLSYAQQNSSIQIELCAIPNSA